jgi:regulator of RNase E activity RraB
MATFAGLEFRMPTQQQVQREMQSDLATKNALRDRGDDETKPHIVEHHFFAGNQAALAGVAKIGRMLGFEASGIEQGKDDSGAAYWYFDLLSETPTYLNNLARESLLMLTLAEAHGADYDGWGTLVAK